MVFSRKDYFSHSLYRLRSCGFSSIHNNMHLIVNCFPVMKYKIQFFKQRKQNSHYSNNNVNYLRLEKWWSRSRERKLKNIIETYLNTIREVEGTTCCCGGRKIQQYKLAALVIVSIAKMRHIDHGNSYKRNHSVEAGLKFRSLVH